MQPTDWNEAARKFSIDFDALAGAYPTTSKEFRVVFSDLEEVQRLNKEFYDLDYKNKLSSIVVDELDKEAQQYRQAVSNLVPLLQKSKRPKEEAKRMILEASVRKRQIRYFASQHLPYLRLEADANAWLDDKKKELEKDFNKLRSEQAFHEATESFAPYLKKEISELEGRWTWLKLKWQRLTYNGLSYFMQAKKWSVWRGIWLLILTLGYILILVCQIALYSEWKIPFLGDVKIEGLASIVLWKLLFLPFVTIPIIGYVFASRNYRISSNLAEVYTHRNVSIKLLLAIMHSEAYNRENTSPQERLSIINEAAEAMFKYRANGHLKTRDEKMPSQFTNFNNV